jgi:hypothetical protein
VATVRKLTWESSCNRWRKIYKGRVWTGKRGVKKTDADEYRQSVEDFERWRGEIDGQVEATKPHRADYMTALKLRQRIVDWCHLNGLEKLEPKDREFHDTLLGEIDTLRANFSRLVPPPLNDGIHLPIDPLQHAIGYGRIIVWLNRIDALRAYQKWTGTTEAGKTVGANLDSYLKSRKTDAQLGAIAPTGAARLRRVAQLQVDVI